MVATRKTDLIAAPVDTVMSVMDHRRCLRSNKMPAVWASLFRLGLKEVTQTRPRVFRTLAPKRKVPGTTLETLAVAMGRKVLI
jgi:hypothetical protein